MRIVFRRHCVVYQSVQLVAQAKGLVGFGRKRATHKVNVNSQADQLTVSGELAVAVIALGSLKPLSETDRV